MSSNLVRSIGGVLLASLAVTPLTSRAQSSAQPDATAQPAPVSQKSLADIAKEQRAKRQRHGDPVQVLKRVAPTYPAIAKQQRISGTLLVEADVNKMGKVTNMQLVSGPPVFRDAAFEAIKQWQFRPAMLNGQPISQKTQIRLHFMP
ncbi:MAG TPA: energy transducer TonB [Candidatus Angelobacter sp.]